MNKQLIKLQVLLWNMQIKSKRENNAELEVDGNEDSILEEIDNA